MKEVGVTEGNPLFGTAGDLIAWEVGADGTATVRREPSLDLKYLRAIEGTLSEWASRVDEEAYREL